MESLEYGNVLKRSLTLHNYKNLGIIKSTKLAIDSCCENDWGGLVVILGENNIGKSNVLLALRDLGDFFSGKEVDLNKKKPHFRECEGVDVIIELSYKQRDVKATKGAFREKVFSIEFDFLSEAVFNALAKSLKLEETDLWLHLQQSLREEEKFALFTKTPQGKTEIRIYCPNSRLLFYASSDKIYHNALHVFNLQTLKQDLEIESYVKLACNFEITEKCKGIFSDKYLKTEDINELLEVLKQGYYIPKGGDLVYNTTTCTLSNNPSLFKNEFQNPPKILEYKPNKPLGERELTLELHADNPLNIQNSPFFVSLFKILDLDLGSLGRVCEKSQKSSSDAFLEDFEREINEKTQTHITQIFNSLYAKGESVYSFGVRLSSHKISFILKKDGQPILLNEQSSGFIWFFNFFFNFLYNSHLKRGDMVLIDEVETHLSIPAQREIRDFLQDFGKSEGLTFIVTTHSPYFMDINNPNNTRYLKKAPQDYLGSMIISSSSRVNTDKNNALEEILNALAVDYFSIVNPSSQLVFVEGVSDCCYLDAFLALFKEETKNNRDCYPTFVPIGGVGADGNEEYQKALQETLLKIAKLARSTPLLLVDADKPGLEALRNIKALQVVSLRELLGSAVENIEDVFILNDRLKFSGLLKEDSRAFNVKWAKLAHTETKKRFYTIFNYVTNAKISGFFYDALGDLVFLEPIPNLPFAKEIDEAFMDTVGQQLGYLYPKPSPKFYSFIVGLRNDLLKDAQSYVIEKQDPTTQQTQLTLDNDKLQATLQSLKEQAESLWVEYGMAMRNFDLDAYGWERYYRHLLKDYKTFTQKQGQRMEKLKDITEEIQTKSTTS